MGNTNDEPPGVLRLLVLLDEAGAIPVRHGAFVGCLRPDRVPLRLWRELDRCEGQLQRMLPNTATPFRRRQTRRAG